ncbi:MAG: leucyl aminopeptidase [Flavobacteriia bacterium]|nr:leucyl aminopeptidase [Flavobacteriia bacterium]
MFIQKYKAIDSTQHLVIVGTKKSLANEMKTLPTVLVEFLKHFLKSEKKTDYIKTSDSICYFIKGEQDSEKLRVAGASVQNLIGKEAVSIQLIGEESEVLNVAEGIAYANYQFIKYFKDSTKKTNQLKAIYVSDKVDKKKIEELNNVIKAVYWARDMVNEPVSYLNATKLSEEIELLGKEANFTVQVLEKTKIETLKMGGLLAVNKGSIDPPTFTIVEYKPKKATNKKPIVLVGKGVVYDTGGLSLKPTPGSMDCMKSDMAGAACVIGAVYAAALNDIKTHIIALIPATDNRPGLNAYAPGDIVTMYDGTTVEVLNTDAEGRMILADALAYSKKFDPELVIDAATLTGAALRAIGHHASIVMGNASDKQFSQLEKSGNEEFERVVRFPFWDEYYEETKSSIADLKNLGGANAGMITAGKFLEHFVKAPYIHMDIAGPAWLDAPMDYKGKGGTGSGVRLLHNFVKNYK